MRLGTNTCILTELGTSGAIPVGKYQQIRLYLLSNDPAPNETVPAPAENACNTADGYNCVVFPDGSVETLPLSSQSQTGIKIPPGQIEGGGLTVTADQVVEINIDFDACSSIVQLGSGSYRLKPTLHAGEVSINNSGITGRVVDDDTGNPIPNAIVLLERRDPVDLGIDRVINQRLTGSDGRFVLCAYSLSHGDYDVVVAARTDTRTYNATVNLKVPLGNATTNMDDIPLVPEPVPSETATISGEVSTSGGTPAGATASGVVLTALQPVSSTLLVTVPLFYSTSSSKIIDTAAGSCGAGCAGFSLVVPASNPLVGTFNASGTSYTGPSPGDIFYAVNAQAFKNDQDNCSPSSRIVSGIIVQPRVVTPILPIGFTGCTP